MQRKNRSLLLILLLVLTDTMGYGLLLPVMPGLIADIIGGDIVHAAVYGGWLLTAFAVTQLLFAPLIGNLSDRFGRKLFLLFSFFPLVIDSSMLAFAPSAVWLFAGKIAGGMVAGSFSLASAYVADMAGEKQRSRYYSLLNAMVGAGLIGGSVLGGILAAYGMRVPCFVAVMLGIIAILLTLFVLPESLLPNRRRALHWHQVNPVRMFVELQKFRFLWKFIAAMALGSMAMESVECIWSYFTIEKFGWMEQTVGYSLGLMGLLFALIQGGICPFLLPRIGDRMAMIAGLLIQSFTFVGIALADRGWMLFFLALPYAFGTIYGPALQALLSRQVPADRQGELQGGLLAVRNFVSIFSPLIITGLFQSFTKDEAGLYFPGMPFLFVAFFLLIAIGLVWKGVSQGSQFKATE